LPDTEIEEARQISDRLLAKIRHSVWTVDSAVLTVGAQRGIAMVGSGMTLADAIALCDEALYRRKRQVSGAPLDRELRP
jgi:PleD family two-component response regulator